MHDQAHPDPEQLDRLRAGLLDNDPETRTALEAHIDGCPGCQASLQGWRQLGPEALGPALDSDRVAAGLQQARRNALARAGQRRQPVRYASLATAALLLVVVSAGLLTLNTGQQPPQVTAQAQEIPEIYEDIEFYLWLAGQQDEKADDDNGFANST